MSLITQDSDPTPAEIQFCISSIHPIPTGYTGWKIRNDYPSPKPGDLAPNIPLPGGKEDVPWLDVDPREDPEQYLNIIQEYCFEGMINNDFIPQKNQVRDWYHAPWMHYGAAGREPLNGLTAERFLPKHELSSSQNRIAQTWAVGLFNAPAASVFGEMWKDPNNPEWTKDIKFPIGSMVFKLLFTDATDEEIPSMMNAPEWEAVIAASSNDPDPRIRNAIPSKVRILQMDIACRDHRGPLGWIFGTFIYNGLQEGLKGWYGLIPVGLQWGNDPDVTQAAYEMGKRPQELWLNPTATKLREFLNGRRPFWGWNERLNGPADSFISACSSCHSTAQWPPDVDMAHDVERDAKGNWIPKDDTKAMKYFRNITHGRPFRQGALSGDYSLQLVIGYDNFRIWAGSVGGQSNSLDSRKLPPLPRQGPTINYS